MTVHFIGAGPGAADLLTLRAVRLLAASPVCVYAGTYLDAEVLAHCPPDATLIDTPDLTWTRSPSTWSPPTRPGTTSPGCARATRRSTRRWPSRPVGSTGPACPWDVTPGVPAYAAAAAILGRELTVPELAQTVVLTRAQAASTAMPETEALERLAATGATLVLHLAIRRTRELAERLAAFYGAGLPGRRRLAGHPAGRAGAARHPGRHRRPGRGRPGCGRPR